VLGAGRGRDDPVAGASVVRDRQLQPDGVGAAARVPLLRVGVRRERADRLGQGGAGAPVQQPVRLGVAGDRHRGDALLRAQAHDPHAEAFGEGAEAGEELRPGRRLTRGGLDVGHAS